jgi:hypothetical protein
MMPDRKTNLFVCKKCECTADMDKNLCKTVKVADVRQKEMAVATTKHFGCSGRPARRMSLRPRSIDA